MKKQSCLRYIVMTSVAVAAGLAFGAASDLPQRDSTTFDFKYEMESLPTEEDLDEDGFVDFTMNNSDWLGKTTQGFSIFDCSQSSRFIMSGAAGGAAGLYLFQSHAVQPILLREVGKDGCVRDTPTPPPPKESTPYGGFATSIESR